MNWLGFLIVLNCVVGTLLVWRLARIRWDITTQVFGGYLIWDLLSNLGSLAFGFFGAKYFGPSGYLVYWVSVRVLSWGLYTLLVYTQLTAILGKLPGIKRFSQRSALVVFGLAIAIGLASANPEYLAAGLRGTVGLVLVVDRVVRTVLLIVLATTLGFLVWFPVAISRNLAALGAGLVVYLGTTNFLLLVRSFLSHRSFEFLNNLTALTSFGCLVFWLLRIDKAGEEVPVHFGYGWRSVEHDRVTAQLNSLNAILSRSVK